MDMKKLFFAPWILTGIRVFLGILFLTAGIGKLVPGFPGLMGPPWLEAVLAKYDLALFARFIAYSQILIGWLLLSRKFATIGAVMLLPMLLNILMVTISQNWKGTPYVVCVFLMLNIWFLAADYLNLIVLLTEDTSDLKPLPIIRKDPVSAKLIMAALILFFIGASLGKTNIPVALVFIGTGFFTGILLPVLLKYYRTREVSTTRN
jgi:uncharacterized membrane protein YphA (DoxX/SURF4 family)